MKKLFKKILFGTIVFFPAFVYALSFADIVGNILRFLNVIVGLIVAVALFIFLYGSITYIFNAGDESKRKESIQYIVFGLFGLFVIVGVWGLVSLLANFIGENVGVPRF
jgi:4-amino-4-deoxy-L-arabinose transferase-like glycosyltransferase